MKNLFKYASLGIVGFMLTGCANTEIDDFEVTKPQTIIDYEYLDDYGNSKDYVKREKPPGFTLGIAASAVDYIAK